MRKVTEKTFKAYAKEAVKQLNTLELFAALRFTAVGVEISLYRNGVEVGRISIQDNGWVHAEDLARDDEFEIIPEHDTMKDLFKAVYITVNGLLDNGWFIQEESEQVEEVTDEPKQYFSVTFEKNGIYSANIAHALKKSDVEAHYSKYNNYVINEAKGYEVEEAKRKHMPIVEIESVKEEAEKQEGRTITVTLHPEDEEEEITITYEDAKGFHHVVGQEALEIEKSTDGISIDKDHVYIVIEFLDGSEATFRRSSVVRIAEEGHVLLERDPEPTPEEADREVTYTDFKPEQDYSEEEPKVENSKVKAVAQYLSNKITGWYENARIDYGVSGKFLSCKAEGENGIRINWEENGKEYTMVINWFTEYTTEHLYNIWMEQGVEVEEVKPEPNKITDVKAFFDKLVRSFDDAGFGTSCKQLSKSEYSIHAISSPNGEVTITLNLNTGYLWHSADVTVYSGTDCIIIDYAKYSTEADFIKAITEKVIASKREKELEKATKLFESTDSTDNKVRKLRKEFKQWELLRERKKEADEAYEANYKNKELEKAADEAFKAAYKQYNKIARMIAELINVDVLDAKWMLTSGKERVKKILGL
jgi:hypothetical protein